MKHLQLAEVIYVESLIKAMTD